MKELLKYTKRFSNMDSIIACTLNLRLLLHIIMFSVSFLLISPEIIIDWLIYLIHALNEGVDEAIEAFDQLTEEDPFRLDDMDLYSNMLYVKGEKYYLQVLANKAFEVDKYRVETCCIVGKVYFETSTLMVIS